MSAVVFGRGYFQEGIMEKRDVTEDGCIVDKIYAVDIEDDEQLDRLVKSLSCKAKRDIFRLIARSNMSIWNIAQTLNIPLSTVSEHVKGFISAGLMTATARGKEKIVVRQFEKIEIPTMLLDEKAEKHDKFTVQVPIGSYVDFRVKKYCGMISEDGYIGETRDDPNIFYSPLRFRAQLIWFDEGYLDYAIPLGSVAAKQILSISFSMELCSEAPIYNENWKSDITFSVNGKRLCVYTSPGDFGARRGHISALPWWEGTQYGIVKKISVMADGTYIDGERVSDVTVSDLNLKESGVVRLRIAVEEGAKNKGGINLFGSKMGDHRQHIYFGVTYCEL